MPAIRQRLDHPSSLVGRLARLGCTRIGSPGVFGERDPKALFTVAKAQVGRERQWVSYRASSRAWDPRRKLMPVPPRLPLTVIALAA